MNHASGPSSLPVALAASCDGKGGMQSDICPLEQTSVKRSLPEVMKDVVAIDAVHVSLPREPHLIGEPIRLQILVESFRDLPHLGAEVAIARRHND